jgi:hypothetical protein
MVKTFICLGLFLLGIPLGHAYTNFIGYGYKNCATCHYNVFGGGPINDYGRAVFATAISGKVLYPTVSEEKITKYSNFLGAIKPNLGPIRIRPSIDYRRLQYRTDLDGTGEQSGAIDMNVEANMVIAFGEADRFWLSVSTSKYPQPKNSRSRVQDDWVSREYYIGAKFTKRFRAQLGVHDITYGLKIPDHTAYSRDLIGLDQTDQTLGLSFSYEHDKYDAGFHIIGGNPNEEKSEVQQVGFSAYGELNVYEGTRLGASILRTESDFLEKFAMAAHARIPFGKGSSLIGELGLSSKSPILKDNADESALYSFSQGMVRLFRGFHFLTTFEFHSFEQDVDNGTKATQYRYGPGFVWFPIQRVEIRADLQNLRTVSNTETPEDVWNLFINLHLSL